MFACSENEPVVRDSKQIKYGTVCGWCVGEEFIIITSSKVEYQKTIPCGENAGTVKKSIDYCSCEWDLLMASFDYELFKTLEYTDCNVCADGCDEFLEIFENESAHELRFSLNDEIEGMEDLRKKLAELMETMRNLD